jgi:hypothetical protein
MTRYSAVSADWRTATPIPVPAQPAARESILAAWVREIAGAVSCALDTTFTDADYRLTLHDDLPTPSRLQARFTVAGNRVDIDVRWPDPWRAPQYALRVGDRDITVDDDPQQQPTVTLAHAAWLAILDDADRTAGAPVTADTGVR